MRLRRTSTVLGAAALALLGAVSCGGDGDGESTPTRSSVVPTLPRPPATAAPDGNYLANPGFEDAESPWISLEPPDWVRDTDVARTGTASARLPFEVDGPRDRPAISYLVQEVVAQPFPEKISGWYRVERWQRGTPKQYLQFVVIVFGAENAPEFEGWPEDAQVNYQIRYPLVGIDAEPFTIQNAKFHFVTRDLEPTEGEWVYFERPLAADFEDAWGEVPRDYAGIRLLLEVRVDDKSEDALAAADVWYDDVFMGTGSMGGEN